MPRMLQGEIVDATRADNLDRVGPFSTRATFGNFDNTEEGFWHLSGGWCYFWGRVQIDVTGFFGESTVIEIPWQPDSNLTALDNDPFSGGGAGSGTIIGSGYVRDNSTSSNSRVASIELFNLDTADDPHWVAALVLDGTNEGADLPFTFVSVGDRITINGEYPVDMNEVAGVR